MNPSFYTRTAVLNGSVLWGMRLRT